MKSLVVGAGGISRQHLGCLKRIPAVSEIQVCDLSPVTARAMADRFRLDGWTTDYAAALSEFRPDVVHVTTPPSSHHGLARSALDAGCHVILEKPATSRHDQLAELVELADARGLALVEDYNYVFNGPVQAALSGLRSGEYGDLVHVDVAVSLGILAEGSSYLDEVSGRSFRDMPGGAIADFLPHLASVTHAFIGRHRRVESVWTKTLPTHPFASDEMRALVEGASATASIGFSSRAKPDLFSVTVEGTAQRSRINVFEGRAVHERQLQTAGPLIPLVNGLREGRDSGVGSVRALAGKLSGGPGAYGGLWTLVRLVYDALSGGGELPVTTRQMVEVADLVKALTAGEGAAR